MLESLVAVNNLRLELGLQFFSDREFYRLESLDFDPLASLRVYTTLGLAVHDLEGAEADRLPAASNPRDGFLVEMFGKLKEVRAGIANLRTENAPKKKTLVFSHYLSLSIFSKNARFCHVHDATAMPPMKMAA